MLSQKGLKSVTVSRSAIHTFAWARSWAHPDPIRGPKGSRPDSPCALFYIVSDPSRSQGGGHPGPSWSHPAPEHSFQDRTWTGRNRLLGHFRLLQEPHGERIASLILSPHSSLPNGKDRGERGSRKAYYHNMF